MWLYDLCPKSVSSNNSTVIQFHWTLLVCVLLRYWVTLANRPLGNDGTDISWVRLCYQRKKKQFMSRAVQCRYLFVYPHKRFLYVCVYVTCMYCTHMRYLFIYVHCTACCNFFFCCCCMCCSFLFLSSSWKIWVTGRVCFFIFCLYCFAPMCCAHFVIFDCV